MLFELRNNAAERVSHCGVLEFIAEEGMIYMPYWVGGVEKCFVFLLRKFGVYCCRAFKLTKTSLSQLIYVVLVKIIII